MSLNAINGFKIDNVNIANINLSSTTNTSNIRTDKNNEVEDYSFELDQPSKKSLGKTIKYGLNSAVEGAVSLGENVRDFVELHGTDIMGKAMMKVGYINQEIYDEMMEETKANVAINYVKDSADIINEKQDLTGNVYYEDTVRNIGNGIGKTGEIIALSLAGGYIAQSAGATAGATTATTTAANTSKIAAIGQKIMNAMTKSETYTKIARWTMAGFSGAGEELQTSFQNGATLEEGKKASYIKGMWDSFQWIVGEGINELKPFKGINKNIKNSTLRVGLDAIDSGVEGFVQPAIQKIYEDKKYSEIFEENGGWANVGVQALIGGIFSTGNEIFENVKLKNVDTNNIDIINIEKIIDENPEKLFSLFTEKGYSTEYIDEMFKNMSKEEILYVAKNVSQSVDGNGKYKITLPEEYAKSLKKANKELYLDLQSKFEKEIDLKTGKKLEKIFDESDDYYIGVHRTGAKEIAENIYENGLYLSGHLSSGVTNSRITSIDDLEKNISFYDKKSALGITQFINGICESSFYKTIDNSGYGMIVKIPKKMENISDILTTVNGVQTLKPEYIVGKVKTVNGEIIADTNTVFKNLSDNNAVKFKVSSKINDKIKPNIENVSIPTEKLYENSSMFNVEKIKNLSFDDQRKFLENCNIDIISKLFREESFDLKPYKEIIDNKIIKNQDYIGNMCTALYDENLIKYIESNQNIIEKLSDRSLMRLAGKSNKEDHFIYTETILNEIEKRLKNNNFDLSFCSYRLENPSTRVKYDDYQIAMKLLISKNPNYVNEVLDKLRLDWKKNIPVEVYSKINLIGYNQKAMLSKLFDSNQIDNTGIKLLDKIYEKNPNALNNFDFRALDKDFLKAVGEDYALEIGAYPEIMDKLLIIKEKSPVSYEKFINIINDAQKDVSLNNLYSKTSNVLNFLFNNSENIDDLVNLPNDTIINYVFLNENISKKYDINLDEDYLENFYKICDKEFNENILLEGSFFLGEAKDSYFKKYFSIDKIRVEKMIDKYGKHLDEILDKIDNEEGKRAAETLQALMNVYDNKSKSFLENLYKNNNGGIYLSGPEINYIEEILSNEYAKTYVDELIKTNESINSNIYKKVVVDGKIVDVSKIDDNFSLLVYSSDTGFKGEKSLVNDSFIQTWNQTGDLKTHGLSTSFISDKNIGSAPVGNNGVLYGFTKLKSQSIKEMGPYDLHSSISEYGFNSLNNQIFISADSMSKNTTRVYNELVVDRNAVQPNCVILYSDASEQVKINSYKAASEWGIPVVEIDIETLASKQLSKIDDLIKNFDNTGDASNLKEALELYESNISGYKLNAIDTANDVTGGIDHSIITNKFDSKKLEITFLEYIEKIKSSNNMQKISELEDIFESVLNKYEIANTNGTFDISKTKSFIDINTLLSVLKDGVVNE